MATNLLDTLRQNRQALTQPPGMTDESRRVATLLRAKSGREVGGPEIGASSLAEQQAVTQAQQQMQEQVVPQAVLQEQQQGLAAETEAQQTAAQRQALEQSRRFDNIQTRIQTDRILRELEEGRGRLDLAAERAATQQAAFNLRMQNQQYVARLQQAGAAARLADEASFREQLSRDILGENQKLLQKNLEGRAILDVNEREFRKSLAEMGAGDAYSMFREDLDAARQRGLITGVVGMGTAGLGAAGTLLERQERAEEKAEEKARRERQYERGLARESIA